MPIGNPNIAEAGKLTRFKPGVATNPKGKPKGVKNFATTVKEILKYLDDETEYTDDELGRKLKVGKSSALRPLAIALLKIIINPASEDKDKIKAITTILDRMEGKPLQKSQNQNINIDATELAKSLYEQRKSEVVDGDDFEVVDAVDEEEN